jgi:replicative DNA helicase
MAVAFDIEFEENILACALKDVDYLKKAIRVCDAHHFGSPERAWVWAIISDTWSKYRELPTSALIVSKARDDFREESKRETYLKTAAKLFKHKPEAPRASLEKLEKFVRFVNAQLAAERVADALEKNDVDAAESALRKASNVAVGTRKYTLVNWIEEFDERQGRRKYEREHPDEIKSILTGWKTIDKITDGVRPGEFALVMGTTGRGKSIALNNIAHHAAGTGHKVLIVAFEMPAIQVAARQDARWLGVEYSRLKRYDLAPSDLRGIKARYDKAKKHFAGGVKIASFPVRSATIIDVQGLLDDLWTDQAWRPDLILMDSADHLRAIDTVRDAFRLQQSEVYWSVKGLAEEGGYAVWSSVHAKASVAGEVAAAEGAAESYDKSRIADLVISINDPEYKPKRKKAKVEVGSDDDEDEMEDDKFEVKDGEAKARTLEFHIAKYRDGESRRTIKMNAELHVMKITEAAGEHDDV